MKQRIIFFTGAGISAESGIPTFVDIPGIRDRLTRDFAIHHTEEYKETIREMKKACESAEPNAAHLAIATMDYPVITMNIDGLHQKAGSKNVIAVHGRLPKEEEIEQKNFRYLPDIPVLYGDPAPKYQEAYELVDSLDYNNSYFVIVGTSFYTGISADMLAIAKERKANIILINDSATIKVPETVEFLKSVFT